MRRNFSSYHPIVNFTYFIGVIVCSMFFMHPIFLIISFVGSLSYAICIDGKKVLNENLKYSLPLSIGIAVINPLFNHEGSTILGYLRDNPITLESIYYGMAMGILFMSVLLWFYCYNQIVTTDKLIYLIGKGLPTLALVLSMTLRFVPLFKRQFEKVIRAQRGIGNRSNKKTMIQRIKWGLKVLSIVVTWILENAIDTADSMKSRGYGLKGRSNFSVYHFKIKDFKVMIGIMAFLICVLIGAGCGENEIVYFPSVKISVMTYRSFIVYIAYSLLCVLPIVLQIMEDIKWHYLR